MNTKKFTILLTGLFVIFITTVILIKPESTIRSAHTNGAGEVHELAVYRSATCGCCGNWIAYMKAKGYEVEVNDTEDVEAIKNQYGIPQELFSCHTTIINQGQYFVEGHIPEEAIVKLMEDEPDVKGIGMPGMPSASPGMPGNKTGPFEIFQVPHDGHVEPYMSL